MSINPLAAQPFLPNVERHFTRTDTGVSVSVKGTTARGTDITIDKSREKTAEGGVSLSSSVTAGDSFAKTVERTLSADQVDARMSRLHDLGMKLSENPVTGPGGKVHDGRFLINITA